MIVDIELEQVVNPCLDSQRSSVLKPNNPESGT